jgi:hypothetical protein
LEDNREVIWLRADGRRTERGYKSVTILSTPLRTDTAILAALTALKGTHTVPETLDDSAIEAFLRLRQHAEEQSLIRFAENEGMTIEEARLLDKEVRSKSENGE